jgi:predicted metalloprotease with PDZ domain
MRDPKDDRTLSITSHELFHVWNVKRIVPARFTPYDYWRETPTRLLWAMEGLTSYYGELTLVRCGLWSVDRYLRHLAHEIQTLEALPARLHLSLAQASFDAWLSDPSQMHDHANAWFSFYTKGEIVAALLDLTIRRATNGEHSLDDVIRLLWLEYGSGRGMEEDAVERAVARIVDVGDFFTRYLDGVEPLPYEELFGAFGLTFAAATREPEAAALGVRLKTHDGLVMVESVVRGGAGMDAGLLPGDELLAFDATRITNEGSIGAALRDLEIGQTAEVLITRAGAVQRLSLIGRPDPRPIITLRIESASELRRGWLGRES